MQIEGLINKKTGIIENSILMKALKIRHNNSIEINEHNVEAKIKLLCWNIRSIKNYAKKILLSSNLVDNNIDIAFIHETFLKREDKWGIKRYSIKRANSNFRKGVAIIISENLKCKKQIIEVDNDNGRYIKVKLLDKMTNKQIIISSIYLEPNGSAITLGS